MRFFKYLIFIFLSLFSVSVFADEVCIYTAYSSSFDSLSAACSHIHEKSGRSSSEYDCKRSGNNLTLYTKSGNSLGSHGTVSCSESTCKADGSTVTAGRVTISGIRGSQEYFDLTDQAASKFQGTYVCSGGCRYEYLGLLGVGDFDENAQIGDYISEAFAGDYKKTAQTCSDSGNAPNESLGGGGGGNDGGDPKDPNDPNNPKDPNDKDPNDPNNPPDGTGDGSCNGTNNCNVTNNNFDDKNIINAINNSASTIRSAINSGISTLQNAINSASSAITSAVNNVSSKLDTTNSHLNTVKTNTANIASNTAATNQKLDATNTKLDQVNTKLNQTNSLLDGMKGLLNDLKTSVSQVASKLDTTNQKLTDLNNAQQATNQKLDAANKNLSDLKDGQAKTNEHLDNIDKNGKETNLKLDDLKDWLTDDSGVNYNESGKVDIQQHDLGDYEKSYVNWTSACPPDKHISINLMGQSSTLVLSWLPWCQLLREIRWAIIACAYFAAAFIILGMR